MRPEAQTKSEYHRDDLRLYLTEMATGLWVEVIQPAKTAAASYNFEIVLQNTDDSGWPVGLPRVVYKTQIDMSPTRRADFARGFHQLPYRIDSALLARCHLRLLRPTMDTTNSERTM